MTPRASVIVPTYNRAASLDRLLDALDSQCVAPERFEVVVVDDGSTDHTPEVLRGRRHVSSVRQVNQGPGAARNHGVLESTSPLIVFVDDDCVPEEDWLQRLIEADDAAGPQVAGFGGRIAPLHRSFLADFVQGERLVDHSPLDGDPAGLRYIVTANAAFRRTQFRSVGGFDRAMSEAGEDVDLSLRLRALGHRLVRVPDATVRHAHPTSLAGILRIYRRSGGARNRLASRQIDLSIGSGAQTLLSPRMWKHRISDYRRAGAPPWRIPLYLLLRMLCLAAFVVGLVEAKVSDR